MNNSAHISLETLVDIAENRPTSGSLETAMAHVTTCSACDDTLRRVRQLILLMKTDTVPDVPRDVLMSAINIFSHERPSRVRRLVATLTFDSRSARPAFGMRSLYTASRQMLYSAPDTDVDLRITIQGEGRVIAGQVIREGCTEGLVEISGATGYAQASLNELCEFTLPPIPIGNYSLRVTMPDVEVDIPQLNLKD
jgi:hypothetical protein